MLSKESSVTADIDTFLNRVVQDVNYYERIPEGALSEFVNYGIGALRERDTSDVYGNKLYTTDVEKCAETCLQEKAFDCQTVDYDPSTKVCLHSHLIAANLEGIRLPTPRETTTVMHLERIGKWMRYYYVTPYSLIPGNNQRTFARVTPNRCARLCMLEESFICRSFEYRLDDATCLMSDKTSSDVDGLYKQPMVQIHHFEMRPILDCGGRFTEQDGNFASPNWPRHYEHHLNCTWQIIGRKHRVIRLKFTHLDLVAESVDNNCTHNGDRLQITQTVEGRREKACVDASKRTWFSRSSSVNVTLSTDAFMSAGGFRAFYKIEWPCEGSVLTEDHGEFATPNYPQKYPSSRRCDWLIRAPPGHRVLLTFTRFAVGWQRVVNRCSRTDDHVIIYDGRNSYKPELDRVCGRLSHRKLVESTGREMFVNFLSDSSAELNGFHATYTFVENIRTVSRVITVATTTQLVVDNIIQASRGVTEEEKEASRLILGKLSNLTRVASSTEREKKEPSALLSLFAGNTTLTVAAMGSAVVVLLGLFILLTVFFRSRRGKKNKELRYLLRGGSVSSARETSDSNEDRNLPNGNEYHIYESLDENTMFSAPTIHNPTYDRSARPPPPTAALPQHRFRPQYPHVNPMDLIS